MIQKPTIGRSVHIEVKEPIPGQLELGPQRTRPATITSVNDDCTVDLVVFGRAGHPAENVCGVPFSEVPRLDHWSWPPRA